MREAAMRLAAMGMLAMILFTGLLPGKTEKQEDAGITVTGTYEQEEIFIYIRSANAQGRVDGGYLVEVEFTTDTAKSLTDMRMVTVFCGEQKSSFPLTEANLETVHRVNFVDVVQPETVRVEVRAHQTEEGLLLISDGEGQLCGSASAPVNGDRILRLSGACPGASFQIYRIADLSDLLSGLVILSGKPTVKERDTYAIPDRYATTITAEADGTISCNFTREGLQDGIYLAVGEREAFYVCLPLVEASGELRSSVVRLSLGDE